MDADELLRRYLEQRRDQGESELVLDSLSVEEVMRLIGARPRRRRGDDASLATRTQAASPAEPDWRRAVAAARAAASPASATSATPPPATPDSGGRDEASMAGAPPSAAPIDVPDGLVISGERELFGGPIGNASSIAELAQMIGSCTRCRLHAEATNPVPGEGSPQSRLLCVGEAPGANEDATGRPFVGQAGQLLTKILAAINLTREEVFICNVLKHRPPGNRNPQPDEVTACRPFLTRQIELIRPAVIIAFGSFAAQTLLETKLAIGKLRGAVHRYHGVPVIVTYHPAALLRNPAWKRPTWEDVQLARRLLDSAGT